jgi:zinc D-Ala-D-Ala carboxypeptidase
MKLSTNFTLQEMTRSQIAAREGFANEPDGKAIDNLKRLATVMEDVRKVFDAPIIISSGYRCIRLNCDYLKSKSTSAHVIGCAADFTVVGVPVDRAYEIIVESDVQYDKLIREFYPPGWIHLSIPRSKEVENRRENLIIDRSGTRFFKERKK